MQPTESKPDYYGSYTSFSSAKNMVSGVNLFGAVKKLSVSGMSVRNMFYKQPKKQEILQDKNQPEVADAVSENLKLKMQVKGLDTEELKDNSEQPKNEQNGIEEEVPNLSWGFNDSDEE